MVEIMKDAQRFITAPAWNGYTMAPFGDLANATTDAELAQYARKFGVTINHSVGTARMSPLGADYGVVDPDLLVKGVTGLRIVDASILVSKFFFSCCYFLDVLDCGLLASCIAYDPRVSYSSISLYHRRTGSVADQGRIPTRTLVP